VAYGEQEQAEMILKEDPTLLLEKGEVTDYSGRTFKGITAFQYALWALDRHMWRMILKYLPREEAATQLHDHIYNKKAYKDMHGDYYDFVPLIDALQTYVTNFANWTDTQKVKHWCEIVGGAQLSVPAQVANEYCRTDRSFYPVPTFKEDNLPRTLIVYDYSDFAKSESHWFSETTQPESGLRPGRAMAFVAGSASGVLLGRRGAVPVDLEAVTALCNVRTDELVELKRQLLNPDQAPEELNPAPEKSPRVIS
jgi:hypothetical protein